MCNLSPKETCTGCMACMNVCGKEALTFAEDEEGFLQPSINRELCVGCGLCERSCPEVQHQFHLHTDMPIVYAGWNKTDRRVSSSGGAFSSIARHILAKGGYVFGATLDKRLQCRHIEVDSVKGLEQLRGSKYIQSNIGQVYKKVKYRLISDNYVLFTGTPCQVSGLKSYLMKAYPKLVTIDLICHGVPSNALFLSYIDKLTKRLGFVEKEKVVNYEFRRRDGWGESPSISSAEQNRETLYGINALYMSAFDKSAIFRPSCYKCHYATTQRTGDFSIGDFWGLGHQGVPFKHDMTKGVSLLMVNSEKGHAIMKELGEDDFYIKRTLEEAASKNHNLTKVSMKPQNRNDVIRAFLDEGVSLDEIEKRYQLIDKSLKNKLSQLSTRLGLYDLLKKLHNLIGSL